MGFARCYSVSTGHRPKSIAECPYWACSDETNDGLPWERGPTASQRHPGPKLRGAGQSQALVPLGAGDPRILLPCLPLALHLQAKKPPMTPLSSSHPAFPPRPLACQPPTHHLPDVSSALPLWDGKRGGMQVRGCKPDGRGGGSSGAGESRPLPRAACSGRWAERDCYSAPVCLMTLSDPASALPQDARERERESLGNPGAGAISKNTLP